MNLAHRSTADEEMDSATLDPDTYARCLSDLAQVNIVTMTHGATIRWLRRVTRDLPPEQPLAILDVACGHGDLLRAIHRWAQKSGRAVRLEGLDLNPRSAGVAAAATPPGMAITWRTGDVFTHAPAATDFIVTSQFAHHLPDAQVVELLRWLDRHAARGWLVVDLQRHVIAYWGFQLIARIAGWHRIVRQDGAISVARSFRIADWKRLLATAGIAARVTWSLPFRLCVARSK